ncbi:hypothetical protein CMV_023190 [Castanea mollissima]|uniref:Protein kinase domain-containing protein n=1 Tax=Castanea mollissima TaxID=60419 RepID=A0A8J4VJL4_9ROSI|nr:hypothetical protein CMV_023190 [Castanea mollissima]
MEDKKANIVAVTTVISLIILIIVARVFLKLSKAFFLICGAGIAVILAVFAYLVIRRHYNRRRRLLESKLVSEGRELRIEYSFLRKVAGLMGKDESRVMTNIRGTKGYLAPEWLLEQGISEKCDIYSYGMVLLEMIGGQRNICLVENGKDKSERKWIYFPKIVNEKLGEGKLMEVVDPRLVRGGGIDEGEVRRLVYVALWCIQERARLRPSMARVVEMLEGRVAVDAPPDSKMIVVDLLSLDHEEQPQGHDRPKVAAIAPILVDSSCPTTSTYSFAMSVLSPR